MNGAAQDSKKEGGIFIVWRRYQGRVDAMQSFFGYEPRYFGFSYPYRCLRPLEYLRKSMATYVDLKKRRPSRLWIQMPPTPLLYVGALYKKMNPGTCLVADCHCSIVWPPWCKFPQFLRLMNRAVDVIILHNSFAYEEALAFGMDQSRCVLLEDRPAETSPEPERQWDSPLSYPRPWVLFAASFDLDEPIDALLAAARLIPDVTFVVTGDVRRAQGRHDLSCLPPNVHLTGWLDRARYKRLLLEADAIVGLTAIEGIQMSIANEAVGYGKAMVLSGTAIMKELFPTGAVYVESEDRSVADGIKTAIENRSVLEAESRELRTERVRRWTGQARNMQERLARAENVGSAASGGLRK